MAQVFTYGSLMFDPVWQQVVGRRRASRPASMTGYRRWRITGDVYPALVPALGRPVVYGRLYMGVSGRDLDRLDAYEGGLYQRVLARVQTASRPRTRSAFVYRLAPRFRHRLAFSAWRPETLLRGIAAADRPCPLLPRGEITNITAVHPLLANNNINPVYT